MLAQKIILTLKIKKWSHKSVAAKRKSGGSHG